MDLQPQATSPTGFVRNYCAADVCTCNNFFQPVSDNPFQALQAAKRREYRGLTRRSRNHLLDRLKARSRKTEWTAWRAGSWGKVRSLRSWAAAAKADPDLIKARSDRRDNLIRLIDAIADLAWHSDFTYGAGHDALAKRLEVSERTIRRLLDWLLKRQWLGVKSWARSAHYSPTGRNGTQVYSLLQFSQREPTENVHLPGPTSSKEQQIRARDEGQPASRGLENSTHPSQPARNRREALFWSEVLQDRVPELRNRSTRWVRWLLREYWKAGWTPDEVVSALSYAPDGSFWSVASPVNEVGYLRWRLGQWEDTSRRPDGADADSHARRLAGQRSLRQHLASKAATTRTLGSGDHALVGKLVNSWALPKPDHPHEVLA